MLLLLLLLLLLLRCRWCWDRRLLAGLQPDATDQSSQTVAETIEQ